MPAVTRNGFWYAAGRESTFALCRILGGTRITGRENVPATGPLIVVCNHLSHIDPPLLAGIVRSRYIHFMAKEELFHTPFIGWYLKTIGSFPVKRGSADRASIRRALEILEAGGVLGMFPEGHRSEDGRLQPAEGGVGFIVLRSRATVVPVAVTGTEQLLRPHSSRLHFGKVRARIGNPVPLDDLHNQSGREPMVEATRRIMRAITDLLPPEYGPHPGVPLVRE